MEYSVEMAGNFDILPVEAAELRGDIAYMRFRQVGMSTSIKAKSVTLLHDWRAAFMPRGGRRKLSNGHAVNRWPLIVNWQLPSASDSVLCTKVLHDPAFPPPFHSTIPYVPSSLVNPFIGGYST